MNPLDRIIKHRNLPEGCDTWGIKSVHPTLKTSFGFQWPASGWVEVDPAWIDLCVASTWEGMASGGIPAHVLLLVAYSRADVLGGDEHKVRVSRAYVVDVLDGAGVLATGDDLTNADLRRADLTGADLSGANLTNADLTGADLTDARLTYARLTGATLTGANLWRADLTDADLTDADLRHADLTDAYLWRADLTGADLSGADLSGADLSGADLTSIGGNVEEKQCESSDCPVVLYTGEECPVCGR